MDFAAQQLELLNRMEDRSEATRALGVARTERQIAALERIANMLEAHILFEEIKDRPSSDELNALEAALGARVAPLLWSDSDGA
jgi:hypothetical protein